MTSEQLTLTTKNFNIDNLVVCEPTKNSRGGWNIRLKYKSPVTGEPVDFKVQTPKLKTPFGASKFKVDDPNVQPKYSLNLTVDPKDAKMGPFYKMLEALDEKVLRTVISTYPKTINLKNPKKKSVEDLMETYVDMGNFKKMVRYSKKDPNGEKYPPTISLKLKFDEKSNTLYSKVYNKNDMSKRVQVTKENVEDVLASRLEMRSLLLINSVWFIDSKFGITINANEMLLYPGQASMGCQIEESDDEMADEMEKLELENEQEDEPEAENEESDDIDITDDEEEEPEEEEKPKRRGRRSKK